MGDPHFDSSFAINGLPLDLLNEILLKLEPKTLAMMRCTNKYFQSYLSDPAENCILWARARARPSFFDISMTCVGFAVNRNRTTMTFKIVCILEMETMETVYGFEISDGDSWRLSETTITDRSNSFLLGMKPVYLDGTLHWLRNDGSIVAFNPETEQARFIPLIFHRGDPETEQARPKMLIAEDSKKNSLTLLSGTKENIAVYTLLGDSKWALAKQIKNMPIDEREDAFWDLVAYDGKCLVVRDIKMDNFEKVVYVCDIEANSWRVLGSARVCKHVSHQYLYKITPSLFFVEEDKQHKVVVASNDKQISYLNDIMELIDITKY
ncbi:PREDICTED: putative F-box/kelch-repeat protein At1g20940 [Camelina sativa]|uniref:F-box/kelch-repeat protein At1g20940 n=1 Tax=Camelina sativa TaxID=90675 RepID=A0ABM1QWL3_CAMSA|nr:PREDICTED: putative F-box/kelch-repeat protein At1g20940 [Camelina sativa]